MQGTSLSMLAILQPRSVGIINRLVHSLTQKLKPFSPSDEVWSERTFVSPQAHLWDQCQPLGKRQRDQIFIGAKGAGCNLDRRQFSLTPPISGLDGQRPQNFGEASVPQAMPGGGMIAPLGGRTAPSANLSAETMSEIIRIKRTLGSYVAKCRERQETLRLTAFNEV